MPTWVSRAAPKLRGGAMVPLIPRGVGVPILGVSQAWLGRAVSRDSPSQGEVGLGFPVSTAL